MKRDIYPPLESEGARKLSNIQREILKIKKEREAVILAHNYVCREIQEVADFTGDSLGLSREAKKTGAKVIAFAGVDFMAETAKILNPEKIVVIPDSNAGCSLEELCEASKLASLKAEHPDALVISYINCGAKVKVLSDIICTSGNALDIVSQISPDREIIFCPDRNLGSWIEEKLNRKMILWNGYCKAHVKYSPNDILELKKEFPNAPAIAHPECPKEVRDVCDCVCSTEKMISFCKTNPSDTFLIATISEMVHRLRKEVPDKTFVSVPSGNQPSQRCDHMLLNTPEKLLECLKNLSPRIELDASTIEAARAPIERMLTMSK